MAPMGRPFAAAVVGFFGDFRFLSGKMASSAGKILMRVAGHVRTVHKTRPDDGEPKGGGAGLRERGDFARDHTTGKCPVRHRKDDVDG
jgi:hypothetical protein